MKTNVKKIVAAILACAAVSVISIPAFAEAQVSLYYNIGGGPQKTSEECWVYKNTGDSYYASCTTLTNGTLKISGENTTPSKELYFTSTDKIYFKSTTYDDKLYFTGKLNVKDTFDFAQANFTIGA